MLRTTITTGLFALALVTLLTLMGVFQSFAGRDLIAGFLSVNLALLIVSVIGTGYWAAWRGGASSIPLALAQGGGAGLIVSIGLLALELLERAIDLHFVFPNYARPLMTALEIDVTPLTSLLLVVLIAAFGGWLAHTMPSRRSIVLTALLLTLLFSFVGERLRTMLALVDALTVLAVILSGALLVDALDVHRVGTSMLVGALNGAAIAVAVALVARGGGLSPGGILRSGHVEPVFVGLVVSSPTVFVLALVLVGALGSLIRSLPGRSYTVLHYGLAMILVIGFAATQSRWNGWSALVTLVVFLAVAWYTSRQSSVSDTRYDRFDSGSQRVVRVAFYGLTFLGLLTLPLFVGQFGTNTLNLVGLYLLLSIALRIVLDNIGLFNLGIVAFFALGAYLLGILTTPNLLTCGVAVPGIAQGCSGVMTFWQALPLTLIVSGLFGAVTALPLVRLRGDYLAVATFAVGEIVRLVLRADYFRPLLGSAQGIAGIPRPFIDLRIINPAWQLRLDQEGEFYYLILLAIILAVMISSRLRNSRIGRAWRAIRADKRAAQTLGIDIRHSYVVAFTTSAALAGLAGALFAVHLYGAYPDSFTFQVSIVALGLVVTGLGRIMTLGIATLALIGLPEFVRELADYRLLILGIALIIAMRFVTRPWRSAAG